MPEHFLKTSQVTSSNGFVAMNLQHVGWWSPTIIRGEDREAIHIPNHKFTVNVVRNLTQKTHWRIKTHLAISHLDVNKINVRFLTLILTHFKCQSRVFLIADPCFELLQTEYCS